MVTLMAATSHTGADRTRLNFPEVVTQRFGFLADYGYSAYEITPTMVKYRKGDLTIEIYYGRSSYEVGFELGRGDERYALSQLIRASDPTAAEQYRNWSATTPHELTAAVDRLVKLVTQYGEPALRGAPDCFDQLRHQQSSWSERYALDVLEQQVRPKAELAFRESRYREAADLYERIRERLSAAELKKLDIARKRSQ
jgi:hypothetical protein